MNPERKIRQQPIGDVQAWKGGLVVLLPSDCGYLREDLTSQDQQRQEAALSNLVFGEFLRRTDHCITVLDRGLEVERTFDLEEVVCTSSDPDPFEME